MVSKKLSDSIPCHLTPSYAEAVKSLAGAEDIKPSAWLRRLVVAEINKKRLQAQSNPVTDEEMAEIDKALTIDEEKPQSTAN